MGDDDKKTEVIETENGTVIVENYDDIQLETKTLPAKEVLDEPVFVDEDTLALVNDYLVE